MLKIKESTLKIIVEGFVENYLEHYRRKSVEGGHVSKYSQGYPMRFPYWDFYIYLCRMEIDVKPKDITHYQINRVRKIMEKMGYNTRRDSRPDPTRASRLGVDEHSARLWQFYIEVDTEQKEGDR